MSPIKVEIGQYKSVEKGAFKASFSLLIHPHGQKILDCKYFNSGANAWFSFPSKEIKKPDGSKSDYLPLVSYTDKAYLRELQDAVLAELKLLSNPQPKTQTLEMNHGRTSHHGQADSIQSETSELPF
jgi:hypothetical protein